MGKFFPTGAHKVGAAFGCLVPKLVSGQFDPTQQKAVWPSTGNFCRGGAFDSALVGCTAVAILPEEMSRERFEWLKEIGAEVIPTPGCESNVKEIYDKCWEIRRTRPDCVIFNQFEEFGNAAWHYHVTGKTIEEIFQSAWAASRCDLSGLRLRDRQRGHDRGGRLSCGPCIRRFASSPPKRCNARRCISSASAAIASKASATSTCRGFTTCATPTWSRRSTTSSASRCSACSTSRSARRCSSTRVPDDLIQQLPLVGISGICNLVAAIKTAKYYDMDGRDVIFTCLTDSADLYASRLEELAAQHGAYTAERAAYDQARYLDGIATDHLRELTYHDRKALHNFKYFTWVEQQGRTAEELRELWEPEFWERTFAQADEWDEQIKAFNERTGVLELF